MTSDGECSYAKRPAQLSNMTGKRGLRFKIKVSGPAGNNDNNSDKINEPPLNEKTIIPY